MPVNIALMGSTGSERSERRFEMTSGKPIAGALSVLVAGFALAGCGGAGESNRKDAAAGGKSSESAALPQGSEPVDLNRPTSQPRSTTPTGR